MVAMVTIGYKEHRFLRATIRYHYANSVIGWFTLGVNLKEEPRKYESGN